MNGNMLIGIFALTIALVSGLGLLYYFFVPRGQINLRSLMSGAHGGSLAGAGRSEGDVPDEEFERLKALARKKAVKKKVKVSLEEKFFQAGIFSDQDRKQFSRLRIIIPIVVTPAAIILSQGMGANIIIVATVVALLVGLQAPFTILDRRIKYRADEILFYLPLVIEQIAIGVSSSLDIGPCLQRVVQMADERDSHNIVTELLRLAHFHVKSGVSLEEALNEIGRLSGHTELKHAFMSLSQVAKHGGEITRQLQELADAVAMQRETKIEAKIKKLELEATGPVAMVFCGFLVILLVGFGLQVLKAFG